MENKNKKARIVSMIMFVLTLAGVLSLIMVVPVLANPGALEANLNQATETIATTIRNVSGGAAVVCGTICGVKYFTSGRQQSADGAIDWAKRIGLGLGGIALCSQIVTWIQGIA